MNAKKKIIFAINDLGIGGAENMLIEQIRCVNRNLFQVFLITILPNPKINLADKIVPDVTYTAFNFSGLFDFGSWWRLFVFFRKEKFDAVVTNLFNTNLIVRIVAICARVPTILSNELNIYEDKKTWQIIVDWVLARFTKRIFVSSPSVLEFTTKQERIPKEKFLLNYNAIPLKLGEVKNNRGKILKELGLAEDFIYIVTAGRLIEQKGHHFLIEAAREMLNDGVGNFAILIFGQGVLEEELKKQINSLGLQDKVKLLGMSTMEKILAISDIFVLPSLWEGLSIALLQAMDSASPVVATHISGSREVVIDGESGLVVAPSDTKALARALIRLIRDEKLRHRLALGAHERARDFSIENNVQTIENEIVL